MNTRPKKIGLVSLGLLLGSVAHISAAYSQESGYSAKGLPLGAFRLYPTLDVTGEYDDNVFRTDVGEQDDLLFRIVPGAVLASDWGNHMLNLHASATVTRNKDFSSENSLDWNVGAEGRLDATRDVDLTLSGDFSRLHEDRSSPDALGFARRPTEYQLLEAEGVLAYHPSRMVVELGGGVKNFEFDDTSLIGFPFILSNADRDRTSSNVFGKLGYEFSPGYSAFVRSGYNITRFNVAVDRTGANRDSEGFNINGGIDVEITSLISATMYVGYLSQDYNAPLPDVDGLNYGAEIFWNVTPLMNVTFAASRDLTDTTIAGASSSDDRNISLDIDYELLRNFILGGEFSFTNQAFPGSPREDNTYRLGASAKYLLNRYANVIGEYRHQARDSNIVGQDYGANIVSLTLRLQM